MKKFITLSLLLLAALFAPLVAAAQDLTVITDILSSPTGGKTMTVVLILAGAVLYFLAQYQLKKWRIPETVAKAGIWMKDNWPNLVFFIFIIWLVYAYSKPTSFSVGSAIMFGASANAVIDFFQKWLLAKKD